MRSFVFSLVNVVALIGDAVEKARESDETTRRYAESSARDSVTITRSEVLLAQSALLVDNLRHLDSLSQIQVIERAKSLRQQEALLGGQSTILRQAARSFLPVAIDTFNATLEVDTTLPKVRHFMDSLYAVALRQAPAIAAEIPPENRGDLTRGTRLVRTVGGVVVTYEVTNDRAALATRLEPVRFSIDLIKAGDLLYPLWAYPVFSFFCCGLPDPGEDPTVILVGRPTEQSPVVGVWRDGTMRVEVPYGLQAGWAPKVSLSDLMGFTVMATMDHSWNSEIDSESLSAVRIHRLKVSVGNGRNIELGPDRWATTAAKGRASHAFAATLRPSDFEVYPGELTGGPAQRIHVRQTAAQRRR